jgi:spore germination protein KC
MKRKIMIIAAALSLALTLSGCNGMTLFSNYREIEDLELVRTVAADSSDEGINVLICSGPSTEGSEAKLYEESGENLALTLGRMQKTALGREALLSHTEDILIGEELAKNGIDEILDYVERYAEMRLDTNIFIVRGNASDLVKGVTGESTFPADVLSGIEKNLDKTGEGCVFTCKELAISEADNGCGLVMAISAVKDEKLFDGRGDMSIAPAGFGIIKDGKLIDYLEGDETTGALILVGRFKADEICETVEETTLTLTVDGIKTDIEPEFDDNGALMGLNISIKAQANVINMDGDGNLEDKDFRKSAERELSEMLKGYVTAAIERSQSMDIDFLSLGGAAERAEPIKFKKMPESWTSIFRSLNVRVCAESILRRTYDIVDTLDENGEEEPKIWEKLTKFLADS